MDSPGKLLKQVKRRVQSATFGNPIYRLMLDQGPVPEKLSLSLVDLWPGNATAGQELILNQPELFETDAVPEPNLLNRMGEVLRNLRAVGTDRARRHAASLMLLAVEQLEVWQDALWESDCLGERIASWIAFHDFYSAALLPEAQQQVMVCLVRQFRHLLRVQQTPQNGISGLQIIKGLLYGGLALDGGEASLTQALELLRRQLNAEIASDGGHASRCPAVQLHFLRYLIDIRGALRLAKVEVPFDLNTAIERMVPALKLFRHGDGALALFHGGGEDNALWLEAALTMAEAKGRVGRRLAQTFYERLTAGRSLLLVDAGPPPQRPYDQQAHAGLLACEFSVGKERIIVNCGAEPVGETDWRQALAATAAHSTLTLEDTNAAEILPAGGLGGKPREVTAQRYEQEGIQHLELMHDGYAAKFRVHYQRTLSLTTDGEELRGIEMLTGPAGRDFVLRWHLHPSIQAALVHGGQAALLRTPSGAGWRLRAAGGELALESSIYWGGDLPRRTMQLRLAGRSKTDPHIIEWTLTREKKG